LGIILANGCIAAAAQDPATIRVPVRVVDVPTVVTTSDGRFVRDLRLADFSVFDNERRQSPRLDYVTGTLSLAVIVQTNDAVRAWLPPVRRTASVFEGLLMGRDGEAAVITANDDVKIVQSLTSDSARIDDAFRSLAPSGAQYRCLDAIETAADLLMKARPDARRVILLIGQSSDYGSSSRLRDAIEKLEKNNIVLYSLAMPQVGRDLMGSTIAVKSTDGVFGVHDTGIMMSLDLGKLVPEIYRSNKAASGKDCATVLTAETGGQRISFRKLKDFEAGVSAIGEELHTGYVLSYSPDRYDAGYHRIRVELDHPGVVIRSRPGYFVPDGDATVR
jgi:VWFA-related protein